MIGYDCGCKNQGSKFEKAVDNIENLIDKKFQSVEAVISLLVIESFGSKHDASLASEILDKIRRKKNA